MAMLSRAMVLDRPGRFTAREFEVPTVSDSEFVLRVDLVTVCGGDVIEYRGGNRKGRYPLIMGHEVVGEVVAIGAQASEERSLVCGDRVTVEPYLRCGRCAQCVAGDYQFCAAGMVYGVTIPCDQPPFLWGAYSQFMFGAAGARTHRVEASVDRRAGCMVNVVGNGVRWVRTRGELRVGESVLVTGLGVQALAAVLVAKAAGASRVVVACRERDESRQALAMAFGADHIVQYDLAAAPSAGDLAAGAAEAVREATDGGPAVAVECTGSQAMFGLAIEALAPRGRLVAVGTRGGAPLGVDLDGIVFKEIDVRGGLGQAHDTELAAAIVNSGNWPIERMVSHVLPLSEAEAAIGMMVGGRDDVVHIGLDPWVGE